MAYIEKRTHPNGKITYRARIRIHGMPAAVRQLFHPHRRQRVGTPHRIRPQTNPLFSTRRRQNTTFATFIDLIFPAPAQKPQSPLQTNTTHPLLEIQTRQILPQPHLPLPHRPMPRPAPLRTHLPPLTPFPLHRQPLPRRPLKSVYHLHSRIQLAQRKPHPAHLPSTRIQRARTVSNSR